MKNIMLKLDDVSINYGKNKVIKKLSFNFYGPAIYVLKGKNGCGKSTLFKALLNLKKIDSGKIYSSSKIKGMLEEPVGYHDITLKNQISYYLNEKMESANVKKIINDFGLNDNLDKCFRNLSYGMKQKSIIVQTLYGCEDIVLLDEPTISLDYASVCSLVSVLNELKKEKMIIVATHDSYFVEKLCYDCCLKLVDGKIESEECETKFCIKVDARNDGIASFLTDRCINYFIENHSFLAYVGEEELIEIMKKRKELEILSISFDVC